MIHGNPDHTVALAQSITRNFGDASEALALAEELAFAVTDPAQAGQVAMTAARITEYSHALAKQAMSRRSDGSEIDPYGPGNGPLPPIVSPDERSDILICGVWASWSDMAEDVIAGLVFAGFAITVLYVGSLLQLIGGAP